MKVEITKKVVEVEALVESASTPGAFYQVSLKEGSYQCSCLHYQKKSVNCKHIDALKEELSEDISYPH